MSSPEDQAETTVPTPAVGYAGAMQCPSCGHVADEGSRYCAHCGVAIGPLRTADEERRLVTVMFADVAGFTSRSESLDIEDVGAFLDPFHRLAAAEVERYGGIVAKFIGDGVMALFGASTTHEDDPERCVRASLSIQHELARSRLVDTSTVRVRIGVASGEVLVRYLENGQTDAIGDTVNTAARLEAAAPVDGVIVGEATYKATRGVVRYRPANPILAKGKSNPVAAWVAEAIAETVGDPARRPFLLPADRARWSNFRRLCTVDAPAMGRSLRSSRRPAWESPALFMSWNMPEPGRTRMRGGTTGQRRRMAHRHLSRSLRSCARFLAAIRPLRKANGHDGCRLHFAVSWRGRLPGGSSST